MEALCDYGGEILSDSAYFANFDDLSYRYVSAVYDSEIAYMDRYFGKFADGLAEAELLDNTLMVITSDHGESLGEHFTRGHHAILYDPVISIPLILRYPKLIQPEVMNTYASNVDIFPTALNLMGYSNWIGSDVEGFDLFSETFPQERYILNEDLNPTVQNIASDWTCRSLFDGPYKLIINTGTNDSTVTEYPIDTLLINIDLDPDELIDLRLELSAKADSMISILNEWIAEIEVKPEAEIELSDEVKESLKALGYVN